MNDSMDDVGSQGSHCGRIYKYRLKKDKKEPCRAELELEVSVKLVVSNICIS